MSIQIETPEGEEAVTEAILFYDRVNAERAARWEAGRDVQIPILTGRSPFAKDRDIRPFVARQGGEIVARGVAVVDPVYNRHWNSRLGHLVWFEAMPDANEAVVLLVIEVCRWLAERGMHAVRTGFLFGMLDFPLAMDEYETLPPSMLRQNPPYYHRMLKRAGFEVERGMVDYSLRVTPQLRARWESSVESARRAGFQIVTLGELDPAQRVHDLTDTWNDTFRDHWGWVPLKEEEVALLLDEYSESTILDTGCLAYLDGDPVGFVWNASDDHSHAVFMAGRTLDDSERRNVLGIGVREQARGRGVNYAMAAFSYLELARRGWTHLSYTLVLDDNWPSRRTAESLGARVCANYLAYRRNLRR
jgi:GNAT superfamily N-acetyltransferase